jgi:replicative DNA helicase
MSLTPIKSESNAGQYKTRKYLRSFSELYDRVAGTGLVPPQALEIEQSVLGAMMIDKEAARLVIQVIGMRSLEDSPFYREAHTAIYRACMNLAALDKNIDLLTVTQKLKLDGALEEAGGPTYLVELTSKVVTTANVEAHAMLILEKFLSRELIRTCEEMKLRAFLGEDDCFELLNEAGSRLFKLSDTKRHGGTPMRSIRDAVSNASEYVDMVADPEQRVKFYNKTGLEEIDRVLGGWMKSNLVILAGRPGSGKSALATALQRRFARPSAIISIEMGEKEVVIRMCCQEGSASLWHALQGQLDERGKDRFVAGAMKIQDLPITIIAESIGDMTISEIRRIARELVVKEKIELLIVDHIHLVTAENKRDTRNDQIGEITSGLKKLAKECNITVLALCQLNREVEKRDLKKPSLGDLRDSGNIEQDADIVMLLYRPGYYDQPEKFPGETEVNIAKFRNGAPATTRLCFRPFSTDFQDPDGPVIGRIAQEELGMLPKPKGAEAAFV